MKKPNIQDNELVEITGIEHARLTERGFELRGIASNSVQLKRLVRRIRRNDPYAEFELDETKELRDGIYFVNFNGTSQGMAVYARKSKANNANN